MGQVFRSNVLIRFAHCDAAGIIYYPRALELMNGAIEDWFATGLKHSFKVLHLQDGLGIPTVRLEAEFYSASLLGDVLDFELTVGALGRSSMDLVIAASTNGSPRFRANLRLVFMRLDERKSAPIPDSLRTAMQPYLQDS